MQPCTCGKTMPVGSIVFNNATPTNCDSYLNTNNMNKTPPSKGKIPETILLLIKKINELEETFDLLHNKLVPILNITGAICNSTDSNQDKASQIELVNQLEMIIRNIDNIQLKINLTNEEVAL